MVVEDRELMEVEEYYNVEQLYETQELLLSDCGMAYGWKLSR